MEGGGKKKLAAMSQWDRGRTAGRKRREAKQGREVNYGALRFLKTGRKNRLRGTMREEETRGHVSERGLLL